MKPFIKKIICDTETPISLFLKIAQHSPYAFLFESAEFSRQSGRYSFIGFDPLDLHVFPADGNQNPLEILREAYEKIDYQPDENLPSLQAGFVGYFSYETVRHFENIVLPKGTSDIPEGIFFFPKKLLIFDHFEKVLIFVAYEQETLEELLNQYEQLQQATFSKTPPAFQQELASTNITLKTKPDFEQLVTTAQEKIRAGEIFQIVLSQIFEQKTITASFDLYRKLRLQSPSPYMYYLQFPDFSIIGCSPETLIKTEKDQIIVRPIAGTRRRGESVQEDFVLAEELMNDPKERAEHMMLVDLGRNDVGRVAEPGTVMVTRLMQIEKYSHVMHLVSEIQGQRQKEKTLFDIFKAAFPAGTLTGAPKIRAMELIAEFEAKPRGIYGGAVGYFDLSGNMDFAIAIRTMLYQNGKVKVQAGAGIVYDSLPAAENQECLNKAMGPLATLF